MARGPRTTISRVIGGTLLLGGGLGTWVVLQEAYALIGLLPQAAAEHQSSIVWMNAVVVFLFGMLTTVSMLGGRDLLLKRGRGRWLGLIAIAPQVVAFSLAGIQYRFALLGFLGVGAAGIEGRVRIGLVVERGTQIALGFQSLPDWHIYLNVGAVVALGLLLLPGKPSRAGEGNVEVEEAQEAPVTKCPPE